MEAVTETGRLMRDNRDTVSPRDYMEHSGRRVVRAPERVPFTAAGQNYRV